MASGSEIFHLIMSDTLSTPEVLPGCVTSVKDRATGKNLVIVGAGDELLMYHDKKLIQTCPLLTCTSCLLTVVMEDDNELLVVGGINMLSFYVISDTDLNHISDVPLVSENEEESLIVSMCSLQISPTNSHCGYLCAVTSDSDLIFIDPKRMSVVDTYPLETQYPLKYNLMPFSVYARGSSSGAWQCEISTSNGIVRIGNVGDKKAKLVVSFPTDVIDACRLGRSICGIEEIPTGGRMVMWGGKGEKVVVSTGRIDRVYPLKGYPRCSCKFTSKSKGQQGIIIGCARGGEGWICLATENGVVCSTDLPGVPSSLFYGRAFDTNDCVVVSFEGGAMSVFQLDMNNINFNVYESGAVSRVPEFDIPIVVPNPTLLKKEEAFDLKTYKEGKDNKYNEDYKNYLVARSYARGVVMNEVLKRLDIIGKPTSDVDGDGDGDKDTVKRGTGESSGDEKERNNTGGEGGKVDSIRASDVGASGEDGGMIISDPENTSPLIASYTITGTDPVYSLTITVKNIGNTVIGSVPLLFMPSSSPSEKSQTLLVVDKRVVFIAPITPGGSSFCLLKVKRVAHAPQTNDDNDDRNCDKFVDVNNFPPNTIRVIIGGASGKTEILDAIIPDEVV